jgi:DNA oxidative demethylase
MLDLFDTPAIPGLATAPDIVSESEEQALIARIDAEDLQPFRFQQWTGKRLTHSFGWSYDFQTGVADRADPIPEWLAPLRDRAGAFAGLPPEAIVQALLIRYDPGAGIGWHRDRPIYEHVIGVSLGTTAAMRFRRQRAGKWERRTVPLEPRGIYHLSGEVRHEWEHSIAAMAEPRHSVTFRTFSAKGRAATR